MEKRGDISEGTRNEMETCISRKWLRFFACVDNTFIGVTLVGPPFEFDFKTYWRCLEKESRIILLLSYSLFCLALLEVILSCHPSISIVHSLLCKV